MKRQFYNMPAKVRFVVFPIMAAAFLALISYVVMQLWNNLLPEIVHAGTITFWQAMGLFILCKILFGFGRMGRFGGGNRSKFKNRLAERIKEMSPEKRARFEEGFGERMFNCRKMFHKEEPKQEL
jgi:hypothetical protein